MTHRKKNTMAYVKLIISLVLLVQYTACEKGHTGGMFDLKPHVTTGKRNDMRHNACKSLFARNLFMVNAVW